VTLLLSDRPGVVALNPLAVQEFGFPRDPIGKRAEWRLASHRDAEDTARIELQRHMASEWQPIADDVPRSLLETVDWVRQQVE